MANTDSIFLLEDGGAIREMEQAPYQSEDLLQTLIEEHPELLSGQQINPDDPPRWLLVKREAGISRWKIDHLLIDHNGVPTLVEVKRSSDTRIRREVIGQMLEYAANAVEVWSPTEIKMLAEKQAGGAERLAERIRALVGGDEEDIDVLGPFWERVEENLKDGRVRLLFVADRFPPELKLIIEFLNSKMQDVEVLGIELVHYQQGALRVLVPRGIGQSEKVRRAKNRGVSAKTDVEKFLSEMDDEVRKFFEELFQNARKMDLTIYWGSSGFSLKAPNQEGRLIPVMHAFPPGGAGNEDAVLEPIFQNLPTKLGEKLISRLTTQYGFKPLGKTKIQLKVTTQTTKQARGGFDVLVEIINELAQQ